jgi:hypothetical protein
MAARRRKNRQDLKRSKPRSRSTTCLGDAQFGEPVMTCDICGKLICIGDSPDCPHESTLYPRQK